MDIFIKKILIMLRLLKSKKVLEEVITIKKNYTIHVLYKGELEYWYKKKGI